jgi:hypothetical protein
MPVCPRCGTENAAEARFCSRCGQGLAAAPGAPPASPGADATGGIIPYKNPPALVAYYLGLFSIFPLFGFLLGIASLVLGILGLKRRRRYPEVRGSVHAWIGIGCGSLSILVWGAMIVILIVGAMQRP